MRECDGCGDEIPEGEDCEWCENWEDEPMEFLDA